MAKIQATEVRAGTLISHEGKLLRISKAAHVHVGGRGGAYMQVEGRELESGAKYSLRLRTDEKLERPFIEQRKMRYLYADGGDFVFMDETSFEQTALPAALLDGRERLLPADTVVGVNYHGERAIGVEMPAAVVLEITEAEPHVKGATVTGAYKQATVETGATIMVPPFVEKGEKIRVNTDSGEYIERAGDE